MTRKRNIDCGGPDRCVDDLCRGQDYGICGQMSAYLMCIDLGIHTDECGIDHEDDYPYDTDSYNGADACPHENRSWTIGGPGDGEGYVICHDCGRALHPEDGQPVPDTGDQP